MAAPIESRPPVVLTATQYAALFRAGQSCPPFRGLFGRFIWGNNSSDFELLAAREKQLAFLMDEELLRWLPGVNGAQALRAVGKSSDWLLAMCAEGVCHQLVVFPRASSKTPRLATWDAMAELARTQYGNDVAGRLAPHVATLKSSAYEDIDPGGRLEALSCLSSSNKHGHPEYMLPGRLLAMPVEEVTAYMARAFFFHSLGCNSHFKGDGTGPDGLPEYVIPNCRLKDVEGLIALDVRVTPADVREAFALPPPGQK